MILAPVELPLPPTRPWESNNLCKDSPRDKEKQQSSNVVFLPTPDPTPTLTFVSVTKRGKSDSLLIFTSSQMTFILGSEPNLSSHCRSVGIWFVFPFHGNTLEPAYMVHATDRCKVFWHLRSTLNWPQSLSAVCCTSLFITRLYGKFFVGQNQG